MLHYKYKGNITKIKINTENNNIRSKIIDLIMKSTLR